MTRVPTRLSCRPGGSERGLSLVEATIILAVISVLSAMLAPNINDYIAQARQARAREDVMVIANAINEFIADNGENQFLRNASDGTASQPPTHGVGDINRVDLLVSDGDIPTSAELFWIQPVNGAAVDTLSNHLIENMPGELIGNRYRNGPDVTVVSPGGNNIDFAKATSSGFNAPYSWRGPYLRGPVDPDPWGNRYAVNVAFLDPSPTAAITSGITAGFSAAADYPRLDVFVLSAGPDEEIDTNSAQDGALPGDDDVIFIVSSHAK
jgi:type II secretory pathway pseudopilin PulG